MQTIIEIIENILRELNLDDKLLYSESIRLANIVLQTKGGELKNRQTDSVAAAILIQASVNLGKPVTTRRVAKHIDCKERTLNKIY